MAKLVLQESYEPIEVDLKDINGNFIKTVKSKLLTLADIEEITELAGENDKEEGIEDKSIVNKLTRIMIIAFGETEKFWKQFSLKLLTTLNTMIAEDIKKKAVNE